MKTKKDTTKKASRGKAKNMKQKSQLALDANSSYVASFPHVNESLSVYSFQNTALSTSPTPQSKDVQHK